MLERLIRLLLGIFVGRVPVLDRCLTAMQGMITCVHREIPALLTRGITQFGTIARVLSVLVSDGEMLSCLCLSHSFLASLGKNIFCALWFHLDNRTSTQDVTAIRASFDYQNRDNDAPGAGRRKGGIGGSWNHRHYAWNPLSSKLSKPSLQFKTLTPNVVRIDRLWIYLIKEQGGPLIYRQNV